MVAGPMGHGPLLRCTAGQANGHKPQAPSKHNRGLLQKTAPPVLQKPWWKMAAHSTPKITALIHVKGSCHWVQEKYQHPLPKAHIFLLLPKRGPLMTRVPAAGESQPFIKARLLTSISSALQGNILKIWLLAPYVLFQKARLHTFGLSIYNCTGVILQHQLFMFRLSDIRLSGFFFNTGKII